MMRITTWGKRLQMVDLHRRAEHFLSIQSDFHRIFKAIVAQFFVKQSTYRLAGFRSERGKERRWPERREIHAGCLRVHSALQRSLAGSARAADRHREAERTLPLRRGRPTEQPLPEQRSCVPLQRSAALQRDCNDFSWFPAFLRNKKCAGCADITDGVLTQTRAFPMIRGKRRRSCVVQPGGVLHAKDPSEWEDLSNSCNPRRYSSARARVRKEGH